MFSASSRSYLEAEESLVCLIPHLHVFVYPLPKKLSAFKKVVFG